MKRQMPKDSLPRRQYELRKQVIRLRSKKISNLETAEIVGLSAK